MIPIEPPRVRKVVVDFGWLFAGEIAVVIIGDAISARDIL